MKIAIVGPYPADWRRVTGGIEMVTLNLSRQLVARGHEVHAVTLFFGDEREPNPPQGVGLHFRSSEKAVARWTLFARERRWMIRALQSIRPDVVHIQGTDVYGAILPRVGRDFPTVLTVHGYLRRELEAGLVELPLRAKPGFFLRSAFNAWFERKALGSARHVVCISPYIEKLLGNRRGLQTYSIPNPVDEDFFGLQDRREEGRLLFAGMIRPRKGLLFLVEGMRLLRDRGVPFRLRLVGKVFEPSYYGRLLAAIEAHSLHDRVEFLGVVDDRVLKEEFEKAWAVVLPSSEETAPMVIQQAMAAGKPVVATRVGGVPWMVQQGQTGWLVDYGDVRGLADCLHRVLTEREESAKMGRRAQELARAMFSNTRVVEATLQVYREALEEFSQVGVASEKR
ncbi:MAG: glycosyltransferase family 4 protein [candidate division KSB1 bacterium]|nr:glycosyltransferase family 4 protein [candidate division KSB1 bacterium]